MVGKIIHQEKTRMSKEGVLTVRLAQKEVDQLDALSTGRLSRSLIVRMLIQDFLSQPEKEQRDFLIERLFGEKA